MRSGSLCGAALVVGAFVWSATALAQNTACKADLNADGVVNFGDLAIMKSVFFQSCPHVEDRGLTVFDHQTGLEWEKKTGVVGGFLDGSPHDVNQLYTWSTGTNNPDGTAFTVFLAALNGGAALGVSSDGLTSTGPCYAGHCDWRLPTVGELKTILDCSKGAPCVDPIFGPTQSYYYWSSSSYATSPQNAWYVFFNDGSVNAILKVNNPYVRAVRGGP